MKSVAVFLYTLGIIISPSLFGMESLDGAKNPLGYFSHTYQFAACDGQLIFDVAVASNQGRRPSNDDRYQVIPNSDFPFFALFDGHGGCSAAELAQQHLYQKILNRCSVGNEIKVNAQKIEQAFCDTATVINSALKAPDCGTTAVTIFFTQDEKTKKYNMHVAHIGDSRAVMFSKNQHGSSMMQITTDHLPSNKAERMRILPNSLFTHESGVSYIMKEIRSDPDNYEIYLAMTRCFGHKNLYDIGVSHQPEFITIKLEPGINNILIASDGLWDNLSNLSATVFINDQFIYGHCLDTAVTNLLDQSACADIFNPNKNLDDKEMRLQGTHDNTTIMLISVRS